MEAGSGRRRRTLPELAVVAGDCVPCAAPRAAGRLPAPGAGADAHGKTTGESLFMRVGARRWRRRRRWRWRHPARGCHRGAGRAPEGSAGGARQRRVVPRFAAAGPATHTPPWRRVLRVDVPAPAWSGRAHAESVICGPPPWGGTLPRRATGRAGPGGPFRYIVLRSLISGHIAIIIRGVELQAAAARATRRPAASAPPTATPAPRNSKVTNLSLFCG